MVTNPGLARGLMVAMMLAMPACGTGQTPDNSGERAVAPATDATQDQGAAAFTAVEIARFDSPWALAFLPDGSMLVTEQAGRLIHLSADGRTRRTIAGVPAVNDDGQGGLGDVVLHPRFAENRQVYFSYSAPGMPTGVVLARGRLDDGRLADVETLFTAGPLVPGTGHYAGRIAFGPDGLIYFATGERQKFDPAQDVTGTLGKVLRLTEEGKAAPGNPSVGQGADAAIWSLGHRNPLGLAFDPAGRLWLVEMGPRHGDELNLVLPGRNYGYPLVSNGNHYDGRDIPDHATRPEFEAPKASWVPAISPSSLLFYSGDRFPDWKGKALIGGLSGKALIVVDASPDGAREVERHPMQRIRAVDESPDGHVYLLEDGADARLIKLVPAG